jgi:hypothetical protein
MPAVGDLFGVWQGSCSGLRIPAAAVSCHDFDLRLLDQPSLSRRRFSVGQQGDRLSPLKVADDRAISMIATPRPVINADNARRRWWWSIISTNGSKQRVVANRKPETICEPCCWATTQCQSQMVHQGVQAYCPAGHGSDYVFTETLGENLSAALIGTTDKTSDGQMQFDAPACTRQIGDHPRVAAVNTMGDCTAFGTPAISGLTMCGDDDHICAVVHCLYVQLGRDQIGKPKMGSHGADSPLETKPVESETSSRMSQSQYSTPKHRLPFTRGADVEPFGGSMHGMLFEPALRSSGRCPGACGKP